MNTPRPSATDYYHLLMRSSRVSRGTRAAVESRSGPDDPNYLPLVFDQPSMASLRALLDRVIPQSPPHEIDLAARIDQRLARDTGDGWRYSALPADRDAYRAGLRTLADVAMNRFGCDYAQLDPVLQDELLTTIAAGRGDDKMDGGLSPGAFNRAQMRLWFEEVRADAVRLFIATSRTLAHIGYSGIANGGDGMPKSGFVQVGLGEREDWEPVAVPDVAP